MVRASKLFPRSVSAPRWMALLLAGALGCSAPPGEEDLGPPLDTDGGGALDLTAQVNPDLARPPRCDDKIKNGEESDVDCGGACPARCGAGKGCRSGADCQGTACVGGKCGAASCSDGIKNGTETDVDCGGGCAMAKCLPGLGCAKATDCTSGVCGGGKCGAPGCVDGVANGSETDVDCGGGACQPCGTSKKCAAKEDCLPAHLCDNKVCVIDYCNDGQKNQKETDVDCGGGLCKGCGPNLACQANPDCQSKMCLNGKCQGLLVGVDGNFSFYKVQVMGAMTDTNVYAACKAAGLTVGCQGPMACNYNDNLCKITAEDSCGNPMQHLAKALNCASPANCQPLNGVYQYMGHKWQNDAACGADNGQWCADGGMQMNKFALCVVP